MRTPTPARAVVRQRPQPIILLSGAPPAAPTFLSGVPAAASRPRARPSQARPSQDGAFMGIALGALALVAVVAGRGSVAPPSRPALSLPKLSGPSKPSARKKRKQAEATARARVKTTAAAKRAAASQKKREALKDRGLGVLGGLSPFK